jgi:hypothetical protein
MFENVTLSSAPLVIQNSVGEGGAGYQRSTQDAGYFRELRWQSFVVTKTGLEWPGHKAEMG